MVAEKEQQYQTFLASVQQRKEALRATLSQLLVTDKTFKTLEIGSGHGDFLVQYATRFPERFCIGIDLITQRIEKSKKKAQRASLDNCSFLKARAEEFLECQPEGFLWDEIIVLYPDPWPKKRHHKNRLFQMDFLTLLAKRVTPGAKIHFETDYEEYFSEVCARISAHPAWHPVDSDSYTANTVFARLTGNQGHHAVFQREG
jgi:Predicted S-adenosylmethionine-dependent methyltransferase